MCGQGEGQLSRNGISTSSRERGMYISQDSPQGQQVRKELWTGRRDQALSATFLGSPWWPRAIRDLPNVSDQHLHPHPTFELRKGVFG